MLFWNLPGRQVDGAARQLGSRAGHRAAGHRAWAPFAPAAAGPRRAGPHCRLGRRPGRAISRLLPQALLIRAWAYIMPHSRRRHNLLLLGWPGRWAGQLGRALRGLAGPGFQAIAGHIALSGVRRSGPPPLPAGFLAIRRILLHSIPAARPGRPGVARYGLAVFCWLLTLRYLLPLFIYCYRL